MRVPFPVEKINMSTLIPELVEQISNPGYRISSTPPSVIIPVEDEIQPNFSAKPTLDPVITTSKPDVVDSNYWLIVWISIGSVSALGTIAMVVAAVLFVLPKLQKLRRLPTSSASIVVVSKI